jgi:HicB family
MLSIRLKPELEARLAERAQREGVTKSKWVSDLLARELQAPTAYEVLMELTAGLPGSGNPDNAKHVSRRVKEKLRAKHHR